MLFGFNGAMATFQRLIDWMLAIKHQSYAYINDIVIYLEAWDQHIKAIWAVLQELRQVGQMTNLRKRTLGKAETKYLRFLVGQGHIRPLADQVDIIQDYPPTQSKKQIRPLTILFPDPNFIGVLLL